MLAQGYRPSLDGVRAVAVGAVIAYHLGAPLPGGFLGVDVFFVLSGYLITSLLRGEFEKNGRAELRQFWARRARRLLPALLLLVLACAIAASRGPVLDLPARRADMLSTLAYYANWHFISSDQSYFAGYTGASPLRHMWSLAIEEQFYIVWPLLLVAALRWGRPRTWFAVLLTGVAASAWQMAASYEPANPSRAYLGTDARASQLLVGAILAVALGRWHRALTAPRAERAVRLVSLPLTAVALGSMCLLADSSRWYFYGGAVVFAGVVAGILLSVELNAATALARALRTPVLVACGRISYGLYLWHWPMILWIRGSRIGGGRPWLLRDIAILAATIAAATASYFLVERPIRAGRLVWVRASLRRLAVVAVAALVAVSAAAIEATASPLAGLARQVSDTSVTACPNPDESWCVRVPGPPRARTVAVVGDSTSLALDPGMRAAARARGFRYVQAGHNGCSIVPVPLMSVDGAAGMAQADACADASPAIIKDVETKAHPDVWLVSDRVLIGRIHVGDGTVDWGEPEHDRRLEQGLVALFRRLTAHGAQVVFVVTPPRGDPVDCALRKRGAVCPNRADDPTTTRLRVVLGRAASSFPGVVLVRVDDVLCPEPEQRCSAVIRGVLARYDGIHFTSRFSRLIAPIILDRAERQGVRLLQV